MSRALIIKNADFSVNKLGTISIEEEIPCTGITLNESTLALTSIGSTDTLTASVTPVDTTDTVIWSTSNVNVATVEGGLVTAIACGTATITATCGNYSATCAVTVTHIVSLTFELNKYLGHTDGNDYLNGGELANYAVAGSVSGIKKLSMNTDTYPVVIPKGAGQINISASGFYPYGFWTNSEIASTLSSRLALAYPTDDNFKYNSSVLNSRSVDIPDRTTGTYEGMDACAFVFRCTGTITQEAVDAIVVEFTA